MKKIIKGLLVMLVALSLVACSSDSGNADVKDYGCKTLNVFNWGEYVDESVIRDFEKQYGVKVNYSLFESNEIMYTQLLGGNKYDVLIPSDYMVERLIEENMLQPLDLSLITNYSELADGLKNLPYDPTNEYSIPYFWGTVGIVYNKETIDPALVEELGYNIFLDPSIKDRAFVYDSERDAFMMALKALGYSMNTEDEAQIEEAYQWLLQMDNTINPSYVTDEVIDAMAYGEKDIAVVYSGDAAYILDENEDMAFYMPESGTNIWSDAMVIPATSSCSELAHEFINFMLSYEASYANSLYVGYAANNQLALEELSSKGGDFEGNNAYLPRFGNVNDEVFENNQVLKAKLSDLWIKVKNQ